MAKAKAKAKAKAHAQARARAQEVSTTLGTVTAIGTCRERASKG
jgi:hypothetical protein